MSIGYSFCSLTIYVDYLSSYLQKNYISSIERRNQNIRKQSSMLITFAKPSTAELHFLRL